MGTAGGVEVRAAVAFDEPVRCPKPLDGPLKVGATVVRLDHAAGGDDHGVELPLASERPGHRLVDKGDALIDAALLDQGRPDLLRAHSSRSRSSTPMASCRAW